MGVQQPGPVERCLRTGRLKVFARHMTGRGAGSPPAPLVLETGKRKDRHVVITRHGGEGGARDVIPGKQLEFDGGKQPKGAHP
jgi:hypothetical protein